MTSDMFCVMMKYQTFPSSLVDVYLKIETQNSSSNFVCSTFLSILDVVALYSIQWSNSWKR